MSFLWTSQDLSDNDLGEIVDAGPGRLGSLLCCYGGGWGRVSLCLKILPAAGVMLTGSVARSPVACHMLSLVPASGVLAVCGTGRLGNEGGRF